jgi:uncharacterized membrane protein
VIALVLGLTVVALQLSTTQFSPRLLRKFLRDRANQIVLSVFVATFVYSSAGLYTVGLAAGTRVEQFPRLAVSGAIVLLFASMAMVVYFADHLAHSIQVDAIGARVEKDTLAVVRRRLGGVVEEPAPARPAWAVAIPAARSGYLQNIVYILSAYINAIPSRWKNHLYMLQNRFSDITVLEKNDRREDRS